jgi:hypothetical protein
MIQLHIDKCIRISFFNIYNDAWDLFAMPKNNVTSGCVGVCVCVFKSFFLYFTYSWQLCEKCDRSIASVRLFSL